MNKWNLSEVAQHIYNQANLTETIDEKQLLINQLNKENSRLPASNGTNDVEMTILWLLLGKCF